MWVDNHDAAYDWAKRKTCRINSNTGVIQVQNVEEKTLEPVKEPVDEIKDSLFSKISDKEFIKIGVPDELMNKVKSISDIEEFRKIKNDLPGDSYDALDMYVKGASIEDIIYLIIDEDVEEEIDTEDFESALKRGRTRERFLYVENEENEKELRDMLNAPLERWRVFLHPSQRRIKEREYNGPARVLGGAGTGKTVVAILIEDMKDTIERILRSYL